MKPSRILLPMEFQNTFLPTIIMKLIRITLGYPKMSKKTIRIFSGLFGYALQSSTEEVKTSTLQDLQELTSLFVHYYKGYVLEDLSGLVDFTIKLNR